MAALSSPTFPRIVNRSSRGAPRSVSKRVQNGTRRAAWHHEPRRPRRSPPVTRTHRARTSPPAKSGPTSPRVSPPATFRPRASNSRGSNVATRDVRPCSGGTAGHRLIPSAPARPRPCRRRSCRTLRAPARWLRRLLSPRATRPGSRLGSSRRGRRPSPRPQAPRRRRG